MSDRVDWRQQGGRLKCVVLIATVEELESGRVIEVCSEVVVNSVRCTEDVGDLKSWSTSNLTMHITGSAVLQPDLVGIRL